MRQRFGRSLGLKLVALFLLLAFALGATFLAGMRKTMSGAWREQGQVLVHDYADRLMADIGSPPDTARAQALADRLGLRIRITGPVVNWHSQPPAGGDPSLPEGPRWLRADPPDEEAEQRERSDRRDHAGRPGNGPHVPHGRWLYTRFSADGHEIRFGLAPPPWRDEPRLVGWVTLAAFLALIALAYGMVRRLFRPLGDIHDGALRFGQGDFSTPIPVRRGDELGRVAAQVNTMARSIEQMLDAKRALLLAISHELRSPLTRARLNAELAAPTPGEPADDDAQRAHAALLDDLGEMRDLVGDLLESERLASGHAALQAEGVDVATLVHEVVADQPGEVRLDLPDALPAALLDPMRLRLALRNLLGNALRYGGTGASGPPSLRVSIDEAGGARWLTFTVRDHGPGVPAAQLPHLTEPFFRADAARQRATGGVGLGLHLCKLVAEAHGGSLLLRNAVPGLVAELRLPFSPAEGP
jgi:signal transduction histidine kinase